MLFPLSMTPLYLLFPHYILNLHDYADDKSLYKQICMHFTMASLSDQLVPILSSKNCTSISQHPNANICFINGAMKLGRIWKRTLNHSHNPPAPYSFSWLLPNNNCSNIRDILVTPCLVLEINQR